MKSLLKAALICIFLFAVAGFMAAQSTTPSSGSSFIHFNPPPCDFSNQFYADNGIDSSSTSELNAEPDGRFGTFRQTGPPATGTQKNWVADEDNCLELDPTRRDFRILATTGGNSDDNNSPFTCANFNDSPGCVNQPGIPETLEFISILAFLHNQQVFEASYLRNVGFINGGLQGVQQNPGTDISIGQQLTIAGQTVTEAPGQNLRGIAMQDVVGHFEAYASINQTANTLKCPAGATLASQCTPAPGNFAASPCSLGMIQNLQNPGATTLPQFCFNVADTKDSHGNTISDVATPKLRQNWRFATNRNAMDGSDGNCINNANCASISDSPFGYFCDDLLGMWIITYFWFTMPANTTDATCGPIFKNIGNANGFTADGFPVILTAHELNDELEANKCGAEGQADQGGGDGGAAWLVCPALPDPRNGAIAPDAFLDIVSHGSKLDPFVSSNFTCLQQTGKFCFEPAAGN